MTVGDRVFVADGYKTPPATTGRFSLDYPRPGMAGTVVAARTERFIPFKMCRERLCMGREGAYDVYDVRIDDCERRGCFVPGVFAFTENEITKGDPK